MLVIAHRGASGHAPENTMASFRRALEMGAKAIELDVHQTLDHKLVVAHDDDLKRCGRVPTTCGGGTSSPYGSVGALKRRLKSLHWEEAAAIDIGSWFDKRFAGERLPCLDEVYELLPPSVELHIEIKHGSSVYPGIEERVVDLIHKRGALTRTVVSSFDHEALYSARSLDERVRIGYLLGLTRLATAFVEMRDIAAESLNVSVRQARARTIAAARDRGYKTLVYTVNTLVERERLAKLGVDGIFSNYPELGSWR